MIDWVIIISYAALLFLVVTVLLHFEIVSVGVVHPVKGQLIGFITLTLPVLLYCIFMERSASHATLGKRAMKLKVVGDTATKNIVFRNVVKFLPWEFAHAGVLWINYQNNPNTPFWIWLLLIVPQVLIIVYLSSVIASKGSKSIYDSLAGTSVSLQK